VSGGIQGAIDGELAIMAGGVQSAFARARPILRHLGRATLIGPAGSGQIAKLANQAIVGITICAVAEALSLAQACGADPVLVRDAMLGGFADSAILRQHWERMIARDWTPRGTLQMHLKDLRNILNEATTHNIDLPITFRTAALFESARAAGYGEKDHSAILLELERRNSKRKPDPQRRSRQ
jgi:2-hydroxy-3-oxopropionate reductase